MKDIKILKVNSKTCWISFIVAQLVLVAFMIATLAVPNWVKLDPDADSRYKFEGALLMVSDGLTGIQNPLNASATVDISENSYIRISCASKFLVEIAKKELNSEEYWNLYNAWYSMFDDLWFAGGLFLVFEVTALVSIAVVIATIVLMFWEKYYFHLNLCASVCLWISHIIAIIGWVGYLDVTFSDDCNDLYDGTDPPTVCATTGPSLGLFVLIFLPFIMIPYFFVFFSFVKQVKPIPVVESEVEPNNITQMNDIKSKSKTKEFS